MKPWELAYDDWASGMKYKEIAAKHSISENTVKSWATRYFKPKKTEELATARKNMLKPGKKKKRGAPLGNSNAKGNHGGAPTGNQNNLQHGLYSKVYWDTLTDKEKKMLEELDFEEEQMLKDQIALLSVREHRLMEQINKFSSIEGGQAVMQICRDEDKRSFKKDSNEEALYNQRNHEKVERGEKLPGTPYHISTTTEATYNIIQRLESELTRVQGKKTRCIDALRELRDVRQGGKGGELVDDWIFGVIGGGDSEA